MLSKNSVILSLFLPLIFVALQSTAAIHEDSRSVNNAKLLASLQTPADTVRVIVNINNSLQTKALSTTGSRQKQFQTYKLRDKKSKRLLRNAVSTNLEAFTAGMNLKNIQIHKRFSYTSGFAATVTAEGLAELLSQPDRSVADP